MCYSIFQGTIRRIIQQKWQLVFYYFLASSSKNRSPYFSYFASPTPDTSSMEARSVGFFTHISINVLSLNTIYGGTFCSPAIVRRSWRSRSNSCQEAASRSSVSPARFRIFSRCHLFWSFSPLVLRISSRSSHPPPENPRPFLPDESVHICPVSPTDIPVPKVPRWSPSGAAR